ncbi:AbrB family transcriptional regulator [Aestuariibius sp. HNIBRBA575]|uniref:AbrB family transcriptional regulator n=1 Tax=Aestuariibius sp. HNIBRBA575 TaxID=3233343 RepID=UPI0034A31B8B
MFATVVTAALSGWLVSRTGIPLGWMIGAMLVTAVASLARLPVRKPDTFMDIIRATIGLMLGASITVELIGSVAAWWPTLVLLIVSLAVMFGAGYLALRKIARFDPITAGLCAMPGGIAEMVLLSERQGADQARVAIVHALRIALAILLIPLLIGQIATIEPVNMGATNAIAALSIADWGWIGLCIAAGLVARGRVRMPAPIVLVPMMVSAALHLLGLTSFEVPGSITAVIQVFIGINVGARFAGVPFTSLIAALGAAILVVALQIGTAFFGALLVAKGVGVDPVALTLAYSPGGLAEMSIIALSFDRDVAFVGVHHIFRVMLALMLAPLLLSWLAKSTKVNK